MSSDTSSQNIIFWGKKQPICRYNNMWFVDYQHKLDINRLYFEKTYFFQTYSQITNKTKDVGSEFIKINQQIKKNGNKFFFQAKIYFERRHKNKKEFEIFI